MSLSYFITSLPRLQRNQCLPITSEMFIKRLEYSIDCSVEIDLQLLLLLDHINNQIRKKTLLINNKLFHLIMRKFQYKVIHTAKSEFFKNFISFLVNLHEVIAVILAKEHRMNKKTYVYQLNGRFDSCSQKIMHFYDSEGAGISKRFSWYSKLKATILQNDFLLIEKYINTMKLNAMNRLLHNNLFSIDYIIFYYFKIIIFEREMIFNYNEGKKILDLILSYHSEELNEN